MKILLYVNDGLCVFWLSFLLSEALPLDIALRWTCIIYSAWKMTESPVLGILFAIPPIAI